MPLFYRSVQGTKLTRDKLLVDFLNEYLASPVRLNSLQAQHLYDRIIHLAFTNPMTLILRGCAMLQTFGERITYNYSTGSFEALRDGLIDQKQFISSQRTIFIPPGSPDPNTCTSIHVYVKVTARFYRI